MNASSVTIDLEKSVDHKIDREKRNANAPSVITTFYKPIDPKRHDIQMALQMVEVDERIEKNTQLAKEFAIGRAVRLDEYIQYKHELRIQRRETYNKHRAVYMQKWRKRKRESQGAGVVDLVEEEKNGILTEADVVNTISSLAGNDDDEFDGQSSKRAWKAKPDNWREVARHFQIFRNLGSTRKSFASELKHLNTLSSVRGTLYRWLKDLNNEDISSTAGNILLYMLKAPSSFSQLSRNSRSCLPYLLIISIPR